jgi:TolA-binding protein
MTTWLERVRPVRAAAMSALAVVLVGSAQVGLSGPAFAQDTLAEARLRKMEAEIRALQRQVFPGGDGKYFAPEITPGQPAAAGAAAPASTPVTDLLTRMDSVEAQLARLTAQIEQSSNRLSQLEARAGIAASGAAPTAAAPTAPDANLTAMSGGASQPKPTPAVAAAPAPAPAPERVATSTPAPAASGPSATRLAAVRAVEKPSTGDPVDDEYSYGFRLWDAKLYPEAEQQLKMFVDRYPRHERTSYARNLLGRAYLDEGKPRDAATWFLQNYQADKSGARAPDSLLYLAESMRRLQDTSRACIALAEFAETYAAEAAGRLKSQYDATRAGVKCPR